MNNDSRDAHDVGLARPGWASCLFNWCGLVQQMNLDVWILFMCWIYKNPTIEQGAMYIATHTSNVPAGIATFRISLGAEAAL
jgi:hypothetical protein